MEEKLKSALERLKNDSDIAAVIVFGSYVRTPEYARDIDICVVLNRKMSVLDMGKKRISFMRGMPDNMDIQVFQLLPLYVRSKILKEGKVLSGPDERILYDIAARTIKE